MLTSRRERDVARAERDHARGERDLVILERNVLKKQLSQAGLDNTAQEQYIIALTHDMKSPLSAIRMANSLMRDTMRNNFEDLQDLIDRNAMVAAELANSMLDANLIRAGGKLPIFPEPCEMLGIVKKCHQSLVPSSRKRVALEFDLSEIFGVWDAIALERAFRNLIDNAIKYGGDSPIRVTAGQVSKFSHMAVHNFGETIDPESLLHVFDSRFRVSSRNSKGYGLGLTLVRGIAEAHNGEVEVFSNKDHGTQFTFKVPNQANQVG